MQWIDTPKAPAECDHYPTDDGTRCVHCGIAATVCDPDELGEAMYAEAKLGAILNQTSWLDR